MMKKLCLTLLLLSLPALMLSACGKKNDVRPPADYSDGAS